MVHTQLHTKHLHDHNGVRLPGGNFDSRHYWCYTYLLLELPIRTLSAASNRNGLEPQSQAQTTSRLAVPPAPGMDIVFVLLKKCPYDTASTFNKKNVFLR